MKMFTTTVELPLFLQKITLNTPILSLGSCFADAMGQKLTENKFQIQNNPFGVIFNPISIYKILEISLKNTIFDAQKIIQNQEIWAHYDVHSKMSALSKSQLLENIKIAQHQIQFFFEKPAQNQAHRFLILTFGTAYVYRLKSQRSVVANCHKMPATLFEKTLLSVDEICTKFDKIYALLEPQNSTIILTVSPIRHLRETLPNNQVSKSILRIACHKLRQNYENVVYFPSYEIMMDELRDYRFYAADLIHPNEMAFDYIFDKFSGIALTNSAQDFIKKWAKIRMALAHRPQFEHSISYQNLLIKLLEKVQNITEVNVEQELAEIQQKIREIRPNAN